ncbi:MAG: hypothetical protein LBS70_00915 [Candidatus Accumulibacter sp.]|jgi:hypothetical protein|nr:hypothetical protein [Accumulibacter sp.]
MIHHFDCAPYDPDFDRPLVFDWNDETGEFSGEGAETMRERFREGEAPLNIEPPVYWPISDTKSRSDLAAAVAWSHHLPLEFHGDYPKVDDGYTDEQIETMTGLVF